MVLPRLALFSVLAATACQQLDVPSEEDDGETSATGGGDGGTFVTFPGTSDSGGQEEGGMMYECDPVAQTGCGAGEKCTAVVIGGAVTYGCVSDSTTLDVFDPCEASPQSGVDGCPPGSACFADETDTGVCLPLCLEDSHCGGGLCVPSIVVPVKYCADACSPFENICATPLQCRMSGDRFTCRFAHETDVGTQLAPCVTLDDVGCTQGFVCLPGELVPGCAEPNCCTTLCDTTDAGACEAPAGCIPIFGGAASPGYEDVGACFVPA